MYLRNPLFLGHVISLVDSARCLYYIAEITSYIGQLNHGRSRLHLLVIAKKSTRKLGLQLYDEMERSLLTYTLK